MADQQAVNNPPVQPGPNHQQDAGVQQIIHVGPFNQPLFGPLVGDLVPLDPSGNISLAGWSQKFTNFCVMNGIDDEPLDEHGNHLPVRNMRRMLFIQWVLSIGVNLGFRIHAEFDCGAFHCASFSSVFSAFTE